MKLKRTKLAALALTALMAVGATSLVAYASETDTAATVADVDGGTLVTTGTYKYVFSYPTDGSYTITYYAEKDNVIGGPYTVEATASTKAATCTEPGSITLTATILGTKVTQTYSTDDAKGHTWEAIDINTTESATHESVGYATITYECSVCGETKTEYGVELDQQEHEWSDTIVYEAVSNIKVDSTGAVVLGSDGLPQLADSSYDGYYNTLHYCVDYGTKTVKGETDTGWEYIKTNVVIYAKTVYSAEIIEQSGIADTLKGTTYTYDNLSKLPLDNDSIELTDCEKDGYYVIAYYNQGGQEISQKKVTVTAHHMTVVFAEFSSQDDLEMCTVTYSSNHKSIASIYNKSCYQSVTYNIVTHCTAACCRNTDDTCTSKYVYETSSLSHDGLKKLSSVSATEGPDGDHTIYTTAKTAIDAAVATGNATYDTYKYLYNLVKDNYSKYVVLKNNTSTCTTGGTVEVHYLCMVCGADVKTETVNVKAPGHSEAAPTTENYVAPTCTSTGSYDAITYCENAELYGCTAVLKEVRNVLIPRTKHTNETSVSVNGIGVKDVDNDNEADLVAIAFVGDVVVDPGDGTYLNLVGETLTANNTKYGITSTAYDGTARAHIGGGSGNEYPTSLGVYAYAYTQCDVCGYIVALDQPVTLKITSISKEKTNGVAGSITIEATYKKYYPTAGTTKTVTTSQTFDYFSTSAAYYSRTVSVANGLVQDDDGVYRYYVSDAVATSYTGFISYQGGTFFVANGVLCDTINGLAEYDGTFYYLANGKLQSQYSGMVEYNGEWFYVTDGVLDTLVNGLVTYNGGQFLVAAGRLVQEANGLYQDFDGTWYFLANGQVQTQFTGVTYYDGAFFKLVNGVLDSTYNGTVEYDGHTFNVVAGQLYDEVA